MNSIRIYRGIHQQSKPWLERMIKKWTESHIPSPPYRHFVQIGDPVLRERCRSVTLSEITNPSMQNLVSDLFTTMDRYDSVGASASQIGVPISLFAVKFTPSQIRFWSDDVIRSMEMEPISPRVFINPTMIITDETPLVFRESCCSVNGFSGKVSRAKEVLIRATNLQGQSVEWKARNWAARIAQHEMDHLQGRLFLDQCDSLSFNYWKTVNLREGDFTLSYRGIRGIKHRLLPFKLFFKHGKE